MSDHYHDKADFQKRTLGRLNENVLTKPVKMYVVNVLGGGESDQAAVEMKADSVCKNGESTIFIAVYDLFGFLKMSRVSGKRTVISQVIFFIDFDE